MRIRKQAVRQIGPLGEFCFSCTTGSHQAHTRSLVSLGRPAVPAAARARQARMPSSVRRAHQPTPAARPLLDALSILHSSARQRDTGVFICTHRRARAHTQSGLAWMHPAHLLSCPRQATWTPSSARRAPQTIHNVSTAPAPASHPRTQRREDEEPGGRTNLKCLALFELDPPMYINNHTT